MSIWQKRTCKAHSRGNKNTSQSVETKLQPQMCMWCVNKQSSSLRQCVQLFPHIYFFTVLKKYFFLFCFHF